MTALRTHRFGPNPSPGEPVVLAIHGLTGHGRRWRHLAQDLLADVPVLAPDLRGHGRSPWAPPWGIEQHVADLREVINGFDRVVVVGHSFGGALGLFLAHTVPQQVAALVLLDPATGLPGEEILPVAEATVAHPDYADEEQARADKVGGAWGDVPAGLLDEEIAEHLVDRPGGRKGWRISTAAIGAQFGELARPFVLPRAGLPTVLVQGMRVQPPYVTAELKAGLRAHLGDRFRLVEADCDHMVPQAKPELVAELVREALAAAR